MAKQGLENLQKKQNITKTTTSGAKANLPSIAKPNLPSQPSVPSVSDNTVQTLVENLQPKKQTTVPVRDQYSVASAMGNSSANRMVNAIQRGVDSLGDFIRDKNDTVRSSAVSSLVGSNASEDEYQKAREKLSNTGGYTASSFGSSVFSSAGGATEALKDAATSTLPPEAVQQTREPVKEIRSGEYDVEPQNSFNPIKQLTNWSYENGFTDRFINAMDNAGNWLYGQADDIAQRGMEKYGQYLTPTERGASELVASVGTNVLRDGIALATGNLLGAPAAMGVVTDLMMGLPAYGEALRDARAKGLEGADARKYALLNAGIEVGSEHIFNINGVNGYSLGLEDIISDAIDSSTMRPANKYLMHQLASILTEGGEELVASFARDATDRAMLGQEKGLGESLADAGRSFMQGALSALLLGGLRGNYTQSGYESYKANLALNYLSLSDYDKTTAINRIAELYNVNPEMLEREINAQAEDAVKGIEPDVLYRALNHIPVAVNEANGESIYEFVGRMDKDQQNAVKMAQRLGNAYLAEDLGDDENGRPIAGMTLDDGTVLVSARAEDPVSWVMAHEGLHQARGKQGWNDFVADANIQMREVMGESFQRWFDNLNGNYARYYSNINAPDASLSDAEKKDYYIKEGQRLYQEDPSFKEKMDEEVAAYYVQRNLLHSDESMRRFLNTTGNVAQRVYQSLRDTVRGFGKTLSPEEQTLSDMEKRFTNIVRENALQARSSVGVAGDGSAYQTMYSRSSWEALGDEGKRQLAQAIANQVGTTIESAQKWISDINSIAAAIGADQNRLDYTPNKAYTAVKKNDEYIYTVDMSTLCKKRITLSNTIDEIQKMLPDVILTGDDYIRIRQMMKDRGYEVSCGFCYVESRRKALDDMAQQFIDAIAGREQRKGKKLNTKQPAIVEKARAKDSYVPTLWDLTSAEGSNILMEEHPDIYSAFVDFNGSRGSGKINLIETRTEYNGEIAKFSQKDIDRLNAIGGLRLQSYSDFETPHLIDMMQVVADMSRMGLMSQAFTKVPNFADAFGSTGIKINESLVVIGVDEEGNLIFDDVEGMPHEIAFALRQKYPDTVGTIIVGKDDATIRAAFADPRIDFIIPFHKSGWANHEYEALGIAGYEDYTDYQNERDVVTGKGLAKTKGNLYPHDYWDYSVSGDENAKTYLRLCEEQGRIPKFDNFLSKDKEGHWVAPSGYWKTLIDFKMYDNDGNGVPQRVVTPVFEDDVTKRILDEYEGDHNKYSPKMDIVNDFIKEKGYSLSLSDESEVERRTYQVNGIEGEDIRPYIKGLLNEDGSIALSSENYTSFEKSVKRQIRKLVDNAIWNLEDTNNAKITINKAKTVNALYEALIDRRHCDLYDIQNSFARNNINIYGEKEVNGLTRRTGVNDVFLEALLGYMGFDGGIHNTQSGQTAGRDENGNRVMYSLSDEEWDNQYFDALNRGDMDEARRLRLAHAAENGYTERAYHGTQDFGFTRPDVQYSDDGMSFFMAGSPEVAQTYSGDGHVRQIADASSAEAIQREIQAQENVVDDKISQFVSALNEMAGQSEDIVGESQLRDWVYRIAKENKGNREQIDHALDNLLFTKIEQVLDWVSDDPEYLFDWAVTEEAEKITELERDVIDASLNLDNLLALDSGKGIYDLLVNPDDVLILDANGRTWNRLNLSEDVQTQMDALGESTPRNTRELASRLKDLGYNGYLLDNVYDDGGRGFERQTSASSIWDMFYPESQVKSADTVTYDDNWNAIPLSQRDNPNVHDLRWSLAFNDKGDELSEGQQEYFKDSVVRNRDGNLKVMYHGSDIAFNVFDKEKIRPVDYDAPFNGFWFSSSPNTSPAMHDATVTRPFYLNITNPAPSDVYNRVDREIDESYSRAIRATFGEDGTQGLYDDNANDRLQRGLINEGWHEGSRSMNDELRYRLQDMGYDGIHWDGVPDVNWDELYSTGITTYKGIRGETRQLELYSHNPDMAWLAESSPEGFDYNYADGDNITGYVDRNDFERMQEDVWVAFEPEQIKSIDNLNPTDNPDIRYSLGQQFDNWEDAYADYLANPNSGMLYHAGDLGKAESRATQGYSRGTGHYGTGTYFVSNPYELKYGYGDRPVESVDPSPYNLFRPQNEDDGYTLHEFLRAVDGGIFGERAYTADEIDDYNERATEAANSDDPAVMLPLIEEGRQMLGDYFQDALNVVNRWNGTDFHDSEMWNADTDEITPPVTNEELAQYGEDTLYAIMDAFTEYGSNSSRGWHSNQDIINRAYGMVNDASRILGVSPEEVVRRAEEIDTANLGEDLTRTDDSRATRFIKSFGYEGTDVSGINGLDNTRYGSVIYDLKGNDLARKQANGARFSLSEDIPEQANAFPDRVNQNRSENRFLGAWDRESESEDPYTYEEVSPEKMAEPDSYKVLMEDVDEDYEAPDPEMEEVDFYQSLVPNGKAKGGNRVGASLGFNTIEQAFDTIAGRDTEARKILDDTFIKPLYEAKRGFVSGKDTNLRGLYDMAKKLDIWAGTKESAAAQWLGEGYKTEDGKQIPYTLEDLKKDFPNKWQNIQAMTEYIRKGAEDYVPRWNAMLEQVYPDPDRKHQEDIATWTKQVENLKLGLESAYAIKNPGVAESIEMDIANLQRKIDETQRKIDNGDYRVGKRLTPRKNYFHHFNEIETKGIKGLKNLVAAAQNASGKGNIDPELVGKSEWTQPRSRWMPMLQRRGKGEYTADAVKGFAKYIENSEYAIAFDPVIAHYRDEINKIRKATRQTKNANTMIDYLSDYTNHLAGKTSYLDRAARKLLGGEGNRQNITNFFIRLNNRAKSNAVMGNIQSILKQASNLPNGLANVKSRKAWAKGIADWGKNLPNRLAGKETTGAPMDQSVFLNERYFDLNTRDFEARDSVWKKLKGKVSDFSSMSMEILDKMVAEQIWSAAYYEGIEKGVDDPIYYADDLTKRSVAGRGVGEVPYAMDSAVTKFFMPFQVEVNNQWQGLKGMIRNKDAMGLVTLSLAAYAMNGIYSALGLGDVVPSILGAIIDGLKDLFDKDREETAGEVALNTGRRIAGEAVSYMPGTSLWIPAIMSDESSKALFGEADPTRYGTGTVGLSNVAKVAADILDGDDKVDLMTPLFQLALPSGGRQASRIYNTMQDFNILPSNGWANTPFGGEKTVANGDYSKSGALKYRLPDGVESFDDAMEIAKAFMLGSNATNAAQEYFDNGNKPLLTKERVEKLKENPEVDVDHYIEYLHEANTDGKGGISQREAYKWLSGNDDLTDEERSALWSMTNSQWENTYDTYKPQNETLVENADEDGNGRVTQEEAYKWLSQQYGMTQDEKQAMWEENGWSKSYKKYTDDYVESLKEYNGYTRKDLTKEVDTDESGSMSQEELYQWLKKQSMSEADKREMWKLGGWKSSYDDYKNKESTRASNAAKKELTEKADSDKSGTVTQAEMYAYLMRQNMTDYQREREWNKMGWKTSYSDYKKKHS